MAYICQCDNCCEDSDDTDSTSFSYGFTDDPEDDVYIPIEMKDYLPSDYDPQEEYYKAFPSLIQEDQRWGKQPEKITFIDQNSDSLLDSARSMVSEIELSPRSAQVINSPRVTRGLNLFVFLINTEKDYTKRRALIVEYEKSRMQTELATNHDFQEVMYCLVDARNEMMNVNERVHSFHKALFNCVVSLQQGEHMQEYVDYCESVKKK